MRRKRSGAEGTAEIPLSSMIDVVFLLLVYFIVTQKPIVEDVFLKADLPSGPDRAPTNLLMPLVVDVRAVDGEGRYGFMGSSIDEEKLFGYLRKVANDDPEHTVVVNCGPNAKHDKLVRLLDACADAGLKGLNLVNDAGIPFKGGRSRRP